MQRHAPAAFALGQLVFQFAYAEQLGFRLPRGPETPVEAVIAVLLKVLVHEAGETLHGIEPDVFRLAAPGSRIPVFERQPQMGVHFFRAVRGIGGHAAAVIGQTAEAHVPHLSGKGERHTYTIGELFQSFQLYYAVADLYDTGHAGQEVLFFVLRAGGGLALGGHLPHVLGCPVDAVKRVPAFPERGYGAVPGVGAGIARGFHGCQRQAREQHVLRAGGIGYPFAPQRAFQPEQAFFVPFGVGGHLRRVDYVVYA